MNENDLNIEYICEKTLLNKDDELVPIILDLIQESYRAGLCQTEFDNTMNFIEENQELKEQLKDKIEDYKRMKDNFDSKVDVLTEIDTQQQEFIKYLEDEIHSCEAVSDLLFNFNKEMKVYKEILQKYKEIIGDDK